MPSKKPKLDTFRKVANACGGILSDIAANLGVERSTIYTWCNDDEQFAQALEDSRERFVDLAESNLRKLVAGVPAIEKDENGEKRFAGWIERALAREYAVPNAFQPFQGAVEERLGHF